MIRRSIKFVLALFLFSLVTFQGRSQQIVSAEYFFDIDPGAGNGIPITVIPNDSIDVNTLVPTSSLIPGFHQLVIRVKNSQGLWSIAAGRLIYIHPNVASSSHQLTNAEFYVDTDPGCGNGSVIPVSPGDSIEVSTVLNMSGVPLGNHIVGLRVKDASGLWSPGKVKSFNVCTTYGALSNFSYIKDNHDVNFSNASQYATSCHWNFGDGDTSNITSPFHNYDAVGVYDACLISYNTCTPGGDTMCSNISIDGISNINPSKGGNSGVVTIDIIGAGFLPGTTFSLKKNGQQDISGDTLFIIDPTHIRTTLNLIGADSGFWDVEVITPSDTFLLTNGFQVLSLPYIDSLLTISWSGRSNFRAHLGIVGMSFYITCTNESNNDVTGVPVWIDGLPPLANVSFQNPILSLDSIPEVDSLNIAWDSLPNSFLDSATMTRFVGVIIPRIKAQGTFTIKLIVTVQDTTPAARTFLLNAYIDKPLLLSDDLLWRPTLSDDVNDCLIGIGDLALKEVLDGLGLTTFQQCWYGIQGKKILEKIGYLSKSNPSSPEFGLISSSNTYYSHVKTAAKCTEAVVQLLFAQEVAILKGALKLWKIANTGVELGLTLQACTRAVKKIWKSSHGITYGASVDPNMKSGPGSGTNAHFENALAPFTYSIEFENDSAAGFAVQTATVIDTLDKTKLDISTFGFTFVTIGDTSIMFNDKPTSFIRDFDFVTSMGVLARVTGSLDTATGVIKWVFNTIDTATNQITTNTLSGFLPPDTLYPKGQGSVGYIVEPYPWLLTGDTVENCATIIFDSNFPISVCWESIIDTLKPSSMVNSLPPTTSIDSFLVTWSGTDTIAGIESYSVYVSTNGGDYHPWIVDTSGTSAIFYGVPDSTYSFYSTSVDSAGNTEDPPLVYDAITQVLLGYTNNEHHRLNVSVSPNPGNGVYQLHIVSDEQEKFELNLYDVLGKPVYQLDLSLTKGINNIKIDLSDFAPGVYIMDLDSDKGKIFFKLIKN